jgi:carboxypeptidase C (cathepsin A)
LPEELRSNIAIAYYEAGHMMYIREADHAKFKRDVAEFIRGAASRN